MKTIFKLMHWFKRYDKVQLTVGKAVTFARGAVGSGSVTMGQTVEKLSVQLGKTIPWEFPRAQPKGTPEGQFFQAARGFSTGSQTLLTP